MDKLLTPKDVAEILGIGAEAARKRMISIPGVIDIGCGKKNALLRIHESDLKAYLQMRRVHGALPTIERRPRR